MGPLYAVLQEALNVHAGIQINAGKTQIWNRSGERPEVCNVLERVARASNPRAIVWRLSQLPSELQGIKILGTPLGHPDFVARHLEGVLEEQRVFLSRIPLVSVIQSAWLLLLHCANARANCQIRSVTPEGVEAHARARDDRIWQCLCELLKRDPAEDGREIANLPLVLGGLGLRSASRLREPAHWASWADCLVMIRQRHPDVANRLVAHLEGQPDTPCLRAAATTAWSITGVMGFEPQHEAACRIEQRAQDNLLLRLPDSDKALLRSQGGPHHLPKMPDHEDGPHVFRVLLLRRLQTLHSCRCGLPLDSRGHHRAACARARLRRRSLAIDTTLVSALHANGGAAEEDGVALVAARRRKERTYPELAGLGTRARLVVLGVEVGGRWSRETQILLRLLSRARARREGFLMRVEQAWRLRWGSLLSCTVARAVAMSLLELPGTCGADGVCPPTHEVERDFRFAGLAP